MPLILLLTIRSFFPLSEIPAWYPHAGVTVSPVVLVTASLEMVLSFTALLVAVVGALHAASPLKMKTPTSLPVRVFFVMLWLTVIGRPAPKHSPPTTRIPPELALLVPVYAFPVTVLPLTVAFGL